MAASDRGALCDFGSGSRSSAWARAWLAQSRV